MTAEKKRGIAAGLVQLTAAALLLCGFCVHAFAVTHVPDDAATPAHTKATPSALADVTPSDGLPFKDVDKNTWSYTPIKYCYDRGIMVGASKENFDPVNTVSKAEFITMLARLDGVDTSIPATVCDFADVPMDAWYSSAAQWAKVKNLCKGDTFNGDSTMERQEIAQYMYDFIFNISGIPGFETEVVLGFNDHKEIKEEHRNAVLAMRYLKIMEGDDHNTFHPTDSLTREQMAAVTQRLTDLLVKFTASNGSGIVSL